MAVTSTTQEELAVSSKHYASLITDIHKRFVDQLSGWIHEFIGSSYALNAWVINEFENKMVQALNVSVSELKTQLMHSVDAVVEEARYRAYLDAEKAIPEFDSQHASQQKADIALNQISLRMKLEVVQAMSLIREYSSRVGLYRSHGITDVGARIRARENVKGRIGRYSTFDSIGRKHDAVSLMSAYVLALLTNLEHTTYIEEAAALGFTNFKLVQLGHRRDQMTFGLNDYPANELHPRSEAKVQLIREV